MSAECENCGADLDYHLHCGRCEWQQRAEKAEAALAAAPREDEGRRDLEAIERKHEAYVDPLGGGWDGYQGACRDCDWRGKVHDRKPAARAEASAHEAEAGFVYEVPHQVSAASPVAPREDEGLREVFDDLYFAVSRALIARDADAMAELEDAHVRATAARSASPVASREDEGEGR